MANDNIRHLRVDPHVRRQNRLGKRAVPCEVTDRWLQFPETSDSVPGIGDMMKLAVMTSGPAGPRKLCDLTISREDLAKALATCKPFRGSDRAANSVLQLTRTAATFLVSYTFARAVRAAEH